MHQTWLSWSRVFALSPADCLSWPVELCPPFRWVQGTRHLPVTQQTVQNAHTVCIDTCFIWENLLYLTIGTIWEKKGSNLLISFVKLICYAPVQLQPRRPLSLTTQRISCMFQVILVCPLHRTATVPELGKCLLESETQAMESCMSPAVSKGWWL